MLVTNTLKYRLLAEKIMIFWAVGLVSLFTIAAQLNNRFFSIGVLIWGIGGLALLWVGFKFFHKKMEITSTQNSIIFYTDDGSHSQTEILLKDLKNYKIAFSDDNAECTFSFRLKNGIAHSFFITNKKKVAGQSDVSAIAEMIKHSIDSYNATVTSSEIIKRKLSFLATRSGLVLITVFIASAIVVLIVMIVTKEFRKGFAVLLLCVYMITKALLQRKRELENAKIGCQ